MKLYVASTFDIAGRVQQVAERLEAAGHTVVVKWWSSDGFDLWDKKVSHEPDAFYADPLCGLIYDRDFNGIRDADALVLVASTIVPTLFTGANVELGIALALGKPCYSLGRLKTSAMYHPVVKFKCLNDLVDALQDGEP